MSDKKPRKINSVTFKNEGAVEFTIETPSNLIIIGPNNGGKSQALRDISQELINHTEKRIVVSQIRSDIARTECKDRDPHNQNDRLPNTCRSRFSYSAPQDYGVSSHLKKLFENEELRTKFHKIVLNETGLYCYPKINAQPGDVRIHLYASNSPSETSSINPYEHLDFQSDGIQAFIGIIAYLVGSEDPILLIDEPETCLSPNLANRLGVIMCQQMEERNGTLIVATHSADFLLGCIGSNSSTKVVRVDKSSKKNKAKEIDKELIHEMATTPLLRSTKVLSALFHKTTIVTEGDSDRTFYEEINRNLNIKNLGIQDACFLNALNKDTIPQIVEPLKKSGITVASIADFDIQKTPKGQDHLSNLLSAHNCPKEKIEAIQKERLKIIDYTEGELCGCCEKKMSKTAKIDFKPEVDKATRDKYLEDISENGLFIVPITPNGTVESWLPGLGISSKSKSKWAQKMLQKIGGISPIPTDDVWEFIQKIAAWSAK